MIVIDCERCGNKIVITDGLVLQDDGVACPVCGERHYITTCPSTRAIAAGANSKVTVHGSVAGGDIYRGGSKKR